MAWESMGRVHRWWIAAAVMLMAAMPLRGATTQPTTKPTAFELSFATPEQARAAIADESIEPYFKRLQPLEMAAKTGSPVPGENLAQQQDACRKRYQDAVRAFTPVEQNAVGWYVSKLAAYTYPTYPLLASTPWKFIKLMPDIEGGNPFTRGQYICISSDIAAGMVQEMSNSGQGGSDWLAMVRFAKVLLHEQMHVIQRGNPELFSKFYTDVWGFSHAASIPADPWLVDHQMLDPDAVDQLWIYPMKNGQDVRWIWPLSIVNDAADPGGPAFSDLRMVAVDLKPGANNAFDLKVGPNNVPSMTGLLNVTGYVSKFSPSREVFHPNEASADLFAHVTLMLDVLPSMAPPEAVQALQRASAEFKPRHEEIMKLLAGKK
jgi:hypothetical protein